VLAGLAGYPDQMERAAREAMQKQLSVRQTEELVIRLMNPEGVEQPPEKPARVLDPNVRDAERSLEQSLGVKVEKGKGKIILKYGSLEDFDRILEALAAK
jgi:ParB family chromosome partitioning protein